MRCCKKYIPIYFIIEGKNFKFHINFRRNFSICFLYCIVVTVQTRAFKVSMPINHCSQQFFSHRKRRIKVFVHSFTSTNPPTNNTSYYCSWLQLLYFLFNTIWAGSHTKQFVMNARMLLIHQPMY